MGIDMDANLEDFYRRIARVQAARARGFGFEADGTIGRSYYARPAQKHFPLVKALLFVAVSVMGLKAIIHSHIGADLYDARVAELQAGEGFDRLGGFLMAADPVTLTLSDLIATHVKPAL
jgi:hypothetical protein